MERKKAKKRTFEAYLNERMRDPRFREAWDKVNVSSESSLTETLVRMRVERGLSQEQVAAKVGTKQTAISRLELHPPVRPTSLLKKVIALYGYRIVERFEIVENAT